MSLIDVKGVDVPKLERIVSVENVRCKCCVVKCCIRLKMFYIIKEKTVSFLKQISGSSSSENIETLKK